jgi:hypothetical protein
LLQLVDDVKNLAEWIECTLRPLRSVAPDLHYSLINLRRPWLREFQQPESPSICLLFIKFSFIWWATTHSRLFGQAPYRWPGPQIATLGKSGRVPAGDVGKLTVNS